MPTPADIGKLTWEVWRQDTHGSVELMRTGLSETLASSIADEFDALNHHQGYFALNGADERIYDILRVSREEADMQRRVLSYRDK